MQLSYEEIAFSQRQISVWILACIEHYQPELEESVPRCWYMAPEEFHGVHSAQSDQYALGCLSYLLLTGLVPFKALAKQPAERHRSIQAFLEALEKPQSTAIAEQDTLPHAFGATRPDQEVEEPIPFEVIREEATLAIPEREAFVFSEEPVTAATWSRIRVSGVAPGMLAKPEGRKQPARRSFGARRRSILLVMVCLVLVSVCATGRWLLFSGGQKPSQRNSVLTMLTNAQATTPVTSTQNPSLSPTFPPPSLSSTAMPAPTQPGFVGVTPFVDCVTSTGGSLVAHFGYRNTNAFVVTIPRGGENVVNPSNLDGSQPTSFAPGSQHAVFQLTFFKHQTVTWSLDGSLASASSNSPHC